VRNGTRPRVLTTTAGDLKLRIPKLRTGSFFPCLLERRRRIDQALYAVVMEAYLHGVSTRKVDDLVRALGADTGISRSEVSRICADLDAEVAAFRDRSLADIAYPYVFLDATYCKARVNHRVVSQAVVVAVGVTADGRREVLGMDVGDSEDGAFWTAFLRSLKARGLTGVQLVISDAHTGLKQAIAAVLIGASWQRCRVHFMRNVLAVVPKGSSEMVAAAIRTVFAQPDAARVAEQFDTIAVMLGRQLPKVQTMMLDAKEDLLAFSAFPQVHWRQLWSTNPLSVNRSSGDICAQRGWVPAPVRGCGEGWLVGGGRGDGGRGRRRERGPAGRRLGGRGGREPVLGASTGASVLPSHGAGVCLRSGEPGPLHPGAATARGRGHGDGRVRLDRLAAHPSGQFGHGGGVAPAGCCGRNGEPAGRCRSGLLRVPGDGRSAAGQPGAERSTGCGAAARGPGGVGASGSGSVPWWGPVAA
jgi:transposase-like protein